MDDRVFCNQSMIGRPPATEPVSGCGAPHLSHIYFADLLASSLLVPMRPPEEA
jgi:hypothetical protein